MHTGLGLSTSCSRFPKRFPVISQKVAQKFLKKKSKVAQTKNFFFVFLHLVWCKNTVEPSVSDHPRCEYLVVAYVLVNSKTAHPRPGQTPGHLTFFKNFGQIPRYVASLDGQMPHPLELQRGSNPPPSSVKAIVLNFFSCVKPFIQMYIFCNKQLATVWIKICVNCNFNDNRVIC